MSQMSWAEEPDEPYTPGEMALWMSEIRVNMPDISDAELESAIAELLGHDAEDRVFFRFWRAYLPTIEHPTTLVWDQEIREICFIPKTSTSAR